MWLSTQACIYRSNIIKKGIMFNEKLGRYSYLEDLFFSFSMYSKTTNGVTVTVTPYFLDELSSPQESHYVWAYQVNIKNEGDETVQLISRHWIINHNNGKTENVGPKAPGVVGKYPVLRPGDSFEYNSGCPLRTPY